MRIRTWAPLLVILFVLFTTTALAPAYAAAPIHLAQGDTDEGSEGGEGEGQSDADAESGASEEQAEGEVTEEEGPPWTYQMVWITIVLTLLTALLIGRLYYKMIVSRQKGAA